MNQKIREQSRDTPIANKLVPRAPSSAFGSWLMPWLSRSQSGGARKSVPHLVRSGGLPAAAEPMPTGERDYVELALRKMPVGVLMVEDFDRVVAANRQAQLLLADQKGALSLRSIADLDRSLLLTTTRRSLRQSMNSAGTRWFCVEGVSSIGKRLQITVQHCGLGSSSRQLSVVSLCDISWLINSRFDSDDDVNLVSHDLRLMINSIRLTTDQVKGDHMRGDYRALSKSLDKITQRTDQLLELTEAFLDDRLLDRQELVSRQPVDLIEIIAGACEEAKLSARDKRLKVQFDCVERIQVDGNFSLLSRCMLNLLNNSIRCSPPDGTIDVQVVLSEASVSVTIDDDGPGFPAKVLSAFYARPEASKPPPLMTSARGHGLGLRLVKKVARLHDAQLAISNRAGGGARAELSVLLSNDR